MLDPLAVSLYLVDVNPLAILPPGAHPDGSTLLQKFFGSRQHPALRQTTLNTVKIAQHTPSPPAVSSRSASDSQDDAEEDLTTSPLSPRSRQSRVITNAQNHTAPAILGALSPGRVPVATGMVLGPLLPNAVGRLPSVSSSPTSTTASSESPRTATTIGFSVRPYHDSPPENVVPKVEELDDDELEDTKVPLAMEAEAGASSSTAVVKRPRGRPRKHPRTPPSAITKAPKGRSKTGCITCRRRKKKCDETKPACLHCQKNNVHCEGYPPKDYWQSGKQKAANTLAHQLSFENPRPFPVFLEGIETDLDRFFFEHFNVHVSKILSLHTDNSNPFREILLPMALNHRGLMHSLLSLSGSHLASREENVESKRTFEIRQSHHFGCAIENMMNDPQMAANRAGDYSVVVEDGTVAQMIVLCLNSICAGDLNGEYRSHMDAARHLITTQKSSNPDFQSFLFEFFVYHDVSNSITSLDRKSIMMMEDFNLPQWMVPPEAGALLGVCDGLFGYLSKITQLRRRIQDRRKNGLKPWADFEILDDAQVIDSALRGWQCMQQRGTSRYVASLLYRQCTWIYLLHTIYGISGPGDKVQEAVDEGLVYMRLLPEDSSTQSLMLMPLFLMGCAASKPEQRPEISQAFHNLQAYSNLGNIKYARVIVEDVWKMMDAGDDRAWDYETLIEQRGWDFLIT